MKNQALIITVVTILAIVWVVWYFFMRSPKRTWVNKAFVRGYNCGGYCAPDDPGCPGCFWSCGGPSPCGQSTPTGGSTGGW